MKIEKRNTIGDRLKITAGLLAKTFGVLKENNPLRLAGATAFFTSFALPPIIIILFQVLTLFLNKRMVGTELMDLLTNTLGAGGADAVRQTTRGFRTLVTNWYIAVGGFLFLVFVATTLFTVIKDGFNDIWNIHVKEKPGILFRLKLRGRSFAAILLAGLLFLAGIFVESIEVIGGNYLLKVWPAGASYFTGALSHIISGVIITVWFVILFRYLADARPKWKVAIMGGLVTGVLFTAGKTLLAYLLTTSNIGSIYGTSASIVLVLLFVFYSSFILYYGACFVKVYSEALHQPLKPVHKAYRYQLRKIE